MPCHLHGGRLALCYNICDAGGERRRHLATFLPDGSEQATRELPRDYWGSGILAYGDGLLLNLGRELVYYDAYQTAVSALALYMGVLEATDGKAPTKANIQKLVDAVSTGISDLLTCAVKLGITIKEAVNE